MKPSKEELIALAEKIDPPSPACGERMLEQLSALAGSLNRRMAARQDLIALIGSGNAELMEVNHSNHFQYIASLALLYDATTMVETVIWVIRTYTAHGFSLRYWDIMLPEASQVLLEHLPPEQFREVQVIYAFISRHFTDFATIAAGSASFFEEISLFNDLLDR